MAIKNTEIILFTQSVIRDGFFNETNVWEQGIFWPLPGSPPTETWRIDSGSATHIGPGQGSMQQNGVLRLGTTYKVKIKVSNMGVGEILRVRMGTGLIPGPDFQFISTDGDYEFTMTPTVEDFILECSNNFFGTVSNISVVPIPTDYSLDITEDVSIPITFWIQDLKNPENRKSTYSKSIVLPGTANNNKVFGQLFEIGADSTYDVNKQAEVVILTNGIEQFKGKLQLKEIIRIQNGLNNYDETSYEVTVLGSLANIVTDWGDKTLQDLSFKEYTHTYNMTEQYGSWVGPIKKNGSPYNNFTVASTIAITGMQVNGTGSQARVQLNFGGSHSFTVDSDIFINSNNNLLSGDQTIFSVPSSTSIVLNLGWSVLTDINTPTGTVSIRTYTGEGYYYSMIDRTGKDGNTCQLWYTTEFLPSLHIREILSKSFSLNGYTWDCPLFDSPFFRRLTMPLNSDNFKLTPAQQASVSFRASQTSSINTSYNLYPYPSGSPAPKYGSNINFTSNPNLLFDAFASHHYINPTTFADNTSVTGTIPVNNDSTNPNFDNAGTYNTTLASWTAPSTLSTGPLNYTFFFSGTVANYIKDNYAWNGVSGDLPADIGSIGAGPYSTNNGRLMGRSDSAGVPIPLPVPISSATYSGLYDQEIVLLKTQTAFPYLVRVASFGGGGQQPWSNNAHVSGQATVALLPGESVYLVYYANNKAVMLRNDGKPCIGTSAGGPNGAVKVSVNVSNFIFYNQIDAVASMENIVYDPSILLPNIKIKDFFKSIVNMFNLMIVEDKNNSKNLILRPQPQFYNSTQLDWTPKLDVSQDIVLTPMSELNAKRYRWNYKDDNDFYNKDYVTDWGAINDRNYGDYFLDIDNDFVTGVNKTELIFSPSPLVGRPYAYANCDRTLTTMFSSDGLTVSKLSSLRILIRSLRGTNTPLTIYGGTPTSPNPFVAGTIPKYPTTLWTYFPYAGHLDNVYGPKYDISFDYPLALYYNNDAYTDNNLYNQYYKQFIDEITDKDSKLFSGVFRLTPYDINTLDFRNLYVVDGHLLRLIKIENYDLNGDGLVRCDFLKAKTGIKFTPKKTIGIHTSGVQQINPPPSQSDRTIQPTTTFGNNNYVALSAMNVRVTGDNNFVYDNTSNVFIQNGNRNIVPAGLRNVTIIGTSDVVVQNNGETWINGLQITMNGAILDSTNIIDAGTDEVLNPFNQVSIINQVDAGTDNVLGIGTSSLYKVIDAGTDEV